MIKLSRFIHENDGSMYDGSMMVPCVGNMDAIVV